MKPAWKEASTLILTLLKQCPGNSNWNYKLLTLKRSSKSSFMPNGHVFPGGGTELSDGSKEWLEFFKSFDLNVNEVIKITENAPPIIKNEGLDIPKLLSLKISAIRETFEESGILLCSCKNQKLSDQKWGSFSTFEGLDSWRAKVQEDSSEFFKMCLNYNCYPDVGSLHLWSNWLTPTSREKKRFDTAFFITSLNEKPVAVADKSEIEKLNWASPDELLELNKKKEIWLPPPQFYEISRLLQFKDVENLSAFAKNRSVNGCERWMPVKTKTSNGLVSVLPGDDAYGSPDYETPSEIPEVEMTIDEFRDQSNVLHRMEFVKGTQAKIFTKNYKPTCGHVPPVEES